MRYIATGWLTCLFALSTHGSPDQLEGAAHAKRLAPFVDDQVIAVVHVDFRQIDAKALWTLVGNLTKMTDADLQEQEPRKWLSALQNAGANEIYFVLGLPDFDRGPSIIVPLDKGADADAISRLFKAEKDGGGSSMSLEACERVGDAIFAGSQAARGRLKQPRLKDNADLVKAFDASKAAALKVAVLASADTRKAIEDTLATLPMWLGGGSPRVLTRGAQWGSAGIDITPKLSVRVLVQSADEASAKQVGDWWTRVVGIVQAQEETLKVWPDFAALAPKLRAKADGNRVTLNLDDATLTAFLQPAVTRARKAADRARDANSLKQTGLAFHNYHDAISHFPKAANYDKNGKPLLSWRVHILPYLDQNELYKQFKLDEAWDSEHNKKLIAKMPAVYRTSPNLEAGKTTLLGVAGERATFPGNKAVKILDYRDGTSNTIIVVDVDEAKAVPWTKPEDYAYDPANPGAGLKGRFDGKFAALFCDGSVRMISGKVDPKLLLLLFDRDDGQVIGEIP